MSWDFDAKNLLSRDGTARLVGICTYPFTGVACVSRVYTDLPVFLITPDGVVVRNTFGLDFTRLSELVHVPLIDGTDRPAGDAAE